jgi:hypothetical protein
MRIRLALNAYQLFSIKSYIHPLQNAFGFTTQKQAKFTI